ncbi:MAG TPA: type II toxin-antitoxin system RelE/ParE family toxin [Solirubrobacteraceae bacterium]|jgi:hypothetical protein
MIPTGWEIELTPQAERWFMGLGKRDAERIAASIDQLERTGPGLGRPFADAIKGSRHHNMKELRSIGGHLRMLFAFDPRRHAVLLLGGDKQGDWQGWYRRSVPVADQRYDRHLRDLGRKSACPTPRAGGRSADSGR